MYDMRTLTTRQLQHETKRIREQVEQGESFEWRIRGRTVGYITPHPLLRKPLPWPDLKLRLERSGAVLDEGAELTSDRIYADRGKA